MVALGEIPLPEYSPTYQRVARREERMASVSAGMRSFGGGTGLRIAHVTATDGSLRYLLLNQLLRLQAEGFEVFGVSSAGPHVGYLHEAGIPHVAVSIERKIRPLADLQSVRQLARVFRDQKVTIVHTHTPKPGLLGQLAARWAGVPIVVNTLHGFYFHDRSSYWSGRFYQQMEWIAGQCSDCVLSQNPEDIDTAKRLRLVAPTKLEYLGNGIDLNRFDPAAVSGDRLLRLRRELRLGDGPVVGFVGRHVREKGLLELFEAIRRVKERFADVCLLSIGRVDNDRGDAVEPEATKSIGIADHCRFVGPREDIPALLSLMNVLVLPSHREGFPRAPMEAAAMGIPAIVTDIRGCRQTVDHERTGLLVPVNAPEDLAQAIGRVLEDPSWARSLGRAARAKARTEFDEQVVFDRVVATYRRLLEREGRTRPLLVEKSA